MRASSIWCSRPIKFHIADSIGRIICECGVCFVRCGFVIAEQEIYVITAVAWVLMYSEMRLCEGAPQPHKGYNNNLYSTGLRPVWRVLGILYKWRWGIVAGSGNCCKTAIAGRCQMPKSYTCTTRAPAAKIYNFRWTFLPKAWQSGTTEQKETIVFFDTSNCYTFQHFEAFGCTPEKFHINLVEGLEKSSRVSPFFFFVESLKNV